MLRRVPGSVDGPHDQAVAAVEVLQVERLRVRVRGAGRRGKDELGAGGAGDVETARDVVVVQVRLQRVADLHAFRVGEEVKRSMSRCGSTSTPMPSWVSR